MVNNLWSLYAILDIFIVPSCVFTILVIYHHTWVIIFMIILIVNVPEGTVFKTVSW